MRTTASCSGCGRPIQPGDGVGETGPLLCPDCASAPASPDGSADTRAGSGFVTQVPESARPSDLPGAGRDPAATIATPALALPASGPGLPGTATFARYRVLGLIGEGGMGSVWKAWDVDLQRVVALKRMKDGVAPGSTAIARFLREARLAARLRHPHVVAIHDVGGGTAGPYLTMDFVEGETLADLLRKGEADKRAGRPGALDRLPEEVGILVRICSAIGHAHAQGVIHRDVKPRNVLLDERGCPYVTDFGLAKEVARPGETARLTRADVTASRLMVGTPGYMSPEQMGGNPAAVGPRSDVWSLGVILYEILTGQLPFVHERIEVLAATVAGMDPVPPRRLHPAVPRDLEAVCLEALEKEPERRYATAEAMAEDLRRWERGDVVCARRWTPGRAVWRKLVRHRRRVGFWATIGFLVLLMAIWAQEARERRGARTRGMLPEVASLLTEVEDVVRSAALTREAKTLLARQPRALLDRILEEDASLGPARALRARLSLVLGDSEEAELDLASACGGSPSGLACFLRGRSRAETAFVLGGFPVAGTAAGEARDPRADVLRRAGRDDLLRALGPDAIAELGADERALAQACLGLSTEDPEELTSALAAIGSREHPSFGRLAGLLWLRLDRPAEATEALDRSLRRWPQDPLARLGRAVAELRAAGGASVSAEERRRHRARARRDAGIVLAQSAGADGAIPAAAHLVLARLEWADPDEDRPSSAGHDAAEDSVEHALAHLAAAVRCGASPAALRADPVWQRHAHHPRFPASSPQRR